jgi:hypothetical protein
MSEIFMDICRVGKIDLYYYDIFLESNPFLSFQYSLKNKLIHLINNHVAMITNLNLLPDELQLR